MVQLQIGETEQTFPISGGSSRECLLRFVGILCGRAKEEMEMERT